MDWSIFKNIGKENPKFWNDYLLHFETQKAYNRYVVFYCETTGNNSKKDNILSIGAILIQDNKIEVNSVLTIFLKQDDVFNAETISVTNVKKDNSIEKVIEAEAIIQFLNFIKNATLIGYQILSAIEMINASLSRLNLGKIKNEYMDITAMHQKWNDFLENQSITLDELCNIYKIKKTDRHTATDIAFVTALLFLKLKRKLEL